MVLSGIQDKLFAKGGRLIAAAVFFVGLGLLPVQAMSETEDAMVETGDAFIGKALFTGEKRLQNGGPPCISCHNAGVGELGGGALGPDLTMAYADETKNYFIDAGWINGGGSPVMGPIFSNREITEEEVSHLRTFFKGASERGMTASSSGAFPGIGIVGTAGMIVLFSLIWGRRYSRRNKNTAHDALWRNYGGKGGR